MNAPPAPPSSTRAAGAILALAILGGALVGGMFGQSSAGILIGAGIGVAACLLLWLRDRRG